MSNRRGIAVLTALGVSAVLALLALTCLTLVASHFRAQAHEQEAVQARWNARAGLERYLACGQLAEQGLYALDSQNSYLSHREADGTLIFEGHYGHQSRRLRILRGDPSRVSEEP